MTLTFRNLNISPDTPVRQWPTEAMHTALERGELSDWRRIAEEVGSDPWGHTARQLEEVLSYSHPYGVTELMTGLLDQARRRTEEHERAQIAEEIRQAVADSGLSKAEFAANIGTSGSRLSTYLSGKVTPSATLMLRIRNVVNRLRPTT